MDIITGEGRRRWSEEEKRAIVAEVLASGEAVSRVAHRHSINPSMLFGWRKQYASASAPVAATTFAPVVIKTSGEMEQARREESIQKDPAVLELDFESGARLRVLSSADPELVKAVIKAMTRR
jgi:transposase